MAGHGGGAWKVAYADFVTAMMAFFLVMWITAQNKQLKEAVAHYFNQPSRSTDPDAPESTAPPPAARSGGRSLKDGFNLGPDYPGGPIDLKAKLALGDSAKRDRSQKPAIFTVHDGSRRTLGTIIAFAGESAELDEAGKERLRSLVPLMAGKRNKIEIRGHATRRPLPPGSPYQDNWQLSYARCTATMKYLQERGVEPDRFRLSQAGPFEPYSIAGGSEKQAFNSRVEVQVLGELVEDLAGTSEERAKKFQTP